MIRVYMVDRVPDVITGLSFLFCFFVFIYYDDALSYVRFLISASASLISFIPPS